MVIGELSIVNNSVQLCAISYELRAFCFELSVINHLILLIDDCLLTIHY